MSISFNQVPAGVRVPWVYVDIDNSRAAAGGVPFKTLLIGQKTSAGTAAAGSRVDVTSAGAASAAFGPGSQLARMVEAYRRANPLGLAVAIPLADDAAGVAATGSIAISGTATASGALSLIIGGKSIRAAVNTGDTATAAASALASAITAQTALEVTATNTAGNVNLVAKNKGVAGNEIPVLLNRFSGESTPAGLSVSLTPLSGGASDADISIALAAAGDDQFQIIAAPYTGTANLNAIKTELDRKFGATVQAGGVYVTGKNANFSSLVSLGNSQNSAFVSISDAHEIGNSIAEFAGALAGVVSLSAQNDPARPFQTLEIPGIIPPVAASRFDLQERNLLLNSGIATTNFADAGGLRIERQISTYKTNGAGAPDVSYLDITTVLTLEYIRADFRNYILGKYSRHKLASDGANFGPGQPIITPKIGKAEALKKFRDWELAGLVEGFDQFKNELVVERNATDPNRLDWLMSPDLVNAFIVGGVKIQFLLNGGN